MKIKFLYIFLITAFALQAQNLDSLYKAFVNFKKNSYPSIKVSKVMSENIHYSKCGLGLITQIKENIGKYPPEKQTVIKKLLTRPSLQTSIVSPSGKFRIHYDSVGVNKPGYSVNWFAEILDSVYRFEILKLGYPFPPSDGTAGGDSKYDFYIENLPSGLYGATTPDSALGNLRYTAYTEIDNDFLASERYYSVGEKGAEVTAAHEFHHAVQIGNYIDRYSQDAFYYEITSTAMEEFTFDDVNDYYYYLPYYFRHTDLTLSQNDGYDLAILNIFLQKRFDFDLLKRIWELMVRHRAIEAIALAISERGSTLANEFNKFGVWTYFTGFRADPTTNDFFDYDEAIHYPLITPSTTIEFKPPKKTVNLNTAPVSNMFVYFPDFSTGSQDTLVAIITNCDVQSGINNKNHYINLNYSLLSSNENGAKKINNRYYYNVVSAEKNFLNVSHIFNYVPVTGETQSTVIDYAYPQPFKYSANKFLFIPAPLSSTEEAELFIYSSGMKLIYNDTHRIYSINKVVVRWNALDNNGQKLPSGVYFFVVKCESKIKKGKIVILND